MTATDQENARRWMQAWRTAGPLLEQVRAEEIRATDTVKAMEMLDELFTHAALSQPVRESSGLIEQQAIFSRARRRIHCSELATAAENQRSSEYRARPVCAGNSRTP